MLPCFGTGIVFPPPEGWQPILYSISNGAVSGKDVCSHTFENCGVTGGLKHAAASEIVFWYCCRSKAASQRGQCVCVTREEKLIALVACYSLFFMSLVSASANVGLKKVIKSLDSAYLYQN